MSDETQTNAEQGLWLTVPAKPVAYEIPAHVLPAAGAYNAAARRLAHLPALQPAPEPLAGSRPLR